MSYSHKFEPGSRIRIATQPENQHVYVRGEVGLIKEINGDYADVHTFVIDGSGRCGGRGTVPLDCLEPFSSPFLEQMIYDWETAVAEVAREAERRRSKWNQIAKDASVRFGIDEKIIVEIMQLGRDFE